MNDSRDRGSSITLLGTGLIGMFYASTINAHRGRDRVHVVFSRRRDRAQEFAREWSIPEHTSDLEAAVHHPDTDVVIIGLPNHLHEECVRLATDAGKAILCTKPLGRTADEARRMLQMVEEAGVFHGYLEDLVYTPKTLKAVDSVKQGALGDILWVRSRETHPGPHSAWFWDNEQAGGGALIDMGCHTIEIARCFVGKDNRPVEVMCWTDTLVHPIEAEDHGVALIRFESGAVGQIEVSWAFRGGMDLRDEISGTEGTIWLNHWLRTGFEMYTSGQSEAYVAEKAETPSGWLFPVGDEAKALGYDDMFEDMFEAIASETEPMETFYDGYVVNAVLDACYRSARSRKWEEVILEDWRAPKPHPPVKPAVREVDGHVIIKEERMPDGSSRRILKNKATGEITQTKVEA